MIRSITVPVGDSDYAQAAQAHALALARQFKARLRYVLAREPVTTGKDAAREAHAETEDTAQRALRNLARQAAEQGIEADQTERSEGMRAGLLAEARECDLLVIGMPTEGVANNDPLAETLLNHELPLLRKAESSLLIVSTEPEPVQTIVVSYEGDVAGKMALRLGGHLAEAANAAVRTLSVERDMDSAQRLATAAGRYLQAYKLASVETLARTGQPESETAVLAVAREASANLIVVGAEPYGRLERFITTVTAERVALTTRTPVLVAR